jgi:hypothetical protein
MALTGYTTEEVIRGPGTVVINVTPPAADGFLTIDSEGYPVVDVGGTPTREGTPLGWTKEGATFTRAVEIFEIRADQLQRPVARVIQKETVAIAGVMVQVADQVKLQALLPAAQNLAAGVPGRVNQTFGGMRYIEPSTANSITVTFANPDQVEGGYGYVMLYRGWNWADFSMHITRRNPVEVEFRFEADQFETRLRGDQLGRFYI